MKKTKLRKKKIIRLAVALVLIIVLGVGVYAAYGSYRMSLIPGMRFEEMLAFTTDENKEAVITVGIIQDGQMRYTVYGENGTILPQHEYIYEIGSATKTFTTSLLCKAIYEGKLKLNDSVGAYLSLPQQNYYPTFKKLATHTSGYKAHYFDWQMASNFFSGRNSFYGISIERLIEQAKENNLEDKAYPFEYSNFGLSILGNALSKVYGGTYKDVIEDFIRSELQLRNTKITDGAGELKRYWDWEIDDGYLPAGALESTISDMLAYVNLHMSDALPYLNLGHEETERINATDVAYESLGIRMDCAGLGWMIDTENGILWHNGGTGNYNSYIAFDKENQIGVVILSNLAPDYKIPATVMGARLMRDLQNGG